MDLEAAAAAADSLDLESAATADSLDLEAAAAADSLDLESAAAADSLDLESAAAADSLDLESAAAAADSLDLEAAAAADSLDLEAAAAADSESLGLEAAAVKLFLSFSNFSEASFCISLLTSVASQLFFSSALNSRCEWSGRPAASPGVEPLLADPTPAATVSPSLSSFSVS